MHRERARETIAHHNKTQPELREGMENYRGSQVRFLMPKEPKRLFETSPSVLFPAVFQGRTDVGKYHLQHSASA